MKRGQQFTMTTLGVLVLIGIVIAVVVVIFVQQATQSGRRFSNLTEESVVDVTKCRNVFMGRRCYDDCPAGFSEVRGVFSDCKGDKPVCCEPS